tara:strand:+ start:293 stop:451 length:159 start_codon:yes stop_codon:yes gene_type:complete
MLQCREAGFVVAREGEDVKLIIIQDGKKTVFTLHAFEALSISYDLSVKARGG